MTDERRATAERIAADHLRLRATAEVAGHPDGEDAWLASSWERISVAVVAARRPVVERALRRAGIPEVAAHLVARSPVLRPAWLLAVTAVLGTAVALAVWAPAAGHALLPYLTIAPLLPVAGIAVSYLDRDDAVAAMTAVAPVDPWRVLLVRTTTVTLVTGVLAAVSGLAVPGRPVALWLAPAAATTGLTLLVGRVVALPVAAAVVAGTWVVLVAASVATGAPFVPFEIPWLHLAVGTVAAIGSVVTRRTGWTPS